MDKYEIILNVKSSADQQKGGGWDPLVEKHCYTVYLKSNLKSDSLLVSLSHTLIERKYFISWDFSAELGNPAP